MMYQGVPASSTILIVLDTAAADLVTTIAAGTFNKLAITPVPLLVQRIKDAFVQVPPVAKFESAWIAANVPPGLVDVPPNVARSALPAPEIVPEPSISNET